MVLGSWPFAVFCLVFGLIGLRLCRKAWQRREWVFGADLVPIAFVFAACLALAGIAMLALAGYNALVAGGPSTP